MFCRAFVPLCSVVIYVLIGSELPAGRPRVEFEEDITKRGCHWPTVTARTSLRQLLVCSKAMQLLSRNTFLPIEWSIEFSGSLSSEGKNVDLAEKIMFCDTHVVPSEPWCSKPHST
jgi:hypothetical protein